MTRAEHSPVAGILRISVVVGALVGAVLISPIGAIRSEEDVVLEPTPVPVQLSDPDRRTLEAGRSAPGVGLPAKTISLLTFEGTRIELHNRTRPVVLLFLGSPCTECESELGRIAVTATILFEDAWVAVVSHAGAGEEVRAGVVDAGATDLVFAGTDDEGTIARDLGVGRTPATVVLDGEGKVAAIWQRSVPAGVVVQMVKSLLA